MSTRKKIGRTLYGIMTVVALVVAKYCFDDSSATIDNDGSVTDNVQLLDDVDEYEADLLPDILPQLGVSTDSIYKHKYYTFRYSEKHKQPEWIAYELTKKMVEGHGIERGNFKPDPLIEKNPVTKDDYTNSGFDRGHLVPAADMAWDEEAMAESFYMSNVSPQYPQFNRGVWKKLEERVRKWAKKNGQIYVITGPVLTRRSKGRFPKDKNYIAIPHSFYKVILDYKGPEKKAIAFWLENQESSEDLRAFALSVDDLEGITGLDFFPSLPDEEEIAMEAQFSIFDWDLHLNE